MKEVFGWWLPDEDTHFEHYFNVQQHPHYQKQQFDKAMSYVTQFDFALDIGGHVGLWSRPLSEKFHRVMAFEPNQTFIDLFTLNAPKAQILKVALGDKDGTASLIKDDLNSGMAYLSEGNGIEVITLDSFKYDHIDFIKIDCEGYEFPIVKGATETLKRCSPVVIVEQKSRKDQGHWWSKTAAVEYMIDVLGYRVVSRVLNDWILKKL